MRLVYQSLGTTAYVGIESKDQNEIVEQYYSLWNHGATGGKLHWMSDSFAYISTTPEALEDYFHNSSYHLLLNNYPDTWEGKEETEEFNAEIHKLAEKRLADLMENRETFHSTNLARLIILLARRRPVSLPSGASVRRRSLQTRFADNHQTNLKVTILQCWIDNPLLCAILHYKSYHI